MSRPRAPRQAKPASNGELSPDLASLLSQCREAITDQWDEDHEDTIALVERIDRLLTPMTPSQQQIEARIISRVIADALLDETIELRVDEERTRDLDALLGEITAVDEARLYFHRKGSAPAYGYVLFVLGNDGWDVICDYTVNLEPVLAGANALADQIETEAGR